MPNQNVYLNGMIVQADQARVSVYDAGLLHGASSFTTLLARHGRPFRADRHIRRLLSDVEALGLRATAEPRQLEDALGELLQINGLADARCRITLTAGDTRTDSPTTLITAEPLPDYPSRWTEQGIVVAVADQRQLAQNPTFGHKTGCYLPRILALREAAVKGAEEALWYTTDNHLAEACMCNVFLVIGGVLHTPPLETPVLPGIVREAVLELAKAHHVDCRDDRPLTVREMLAAEEVFLTGSCSRIRPVVQIERHVVGPGTPGMLTRRFMQLLEDLIDAECRPREDRP